MFTLPLIQLRVIRLACFTESYAQKSLLGNLSSKLWARK
jgi:hypothetical protein